MKLTTLAAAFVALASATSFANATAPAAGVFSVNESIVDNANGTYTYNYALTNVSSTTAAWWFIVATDSTDASNVTGFTGWNSTVAASSGFTTLSGWTNAVYTWDSGDSWPTNVPNGVQQGQTFSGLSYTSTLYDPQQKAFLVDVAGYWNNPDFSYGGLTASAVPESGTTLLMLAGLGLLAAGARRRRAN
jgi:hypothetical protein